MKTRVLVVDDSPIIFKMVKRILEPNGYEVVGHAENGEICLKMYENLKPDIITLDVTMPVMDGLATAYNLFLEDPKAKIILLSAMGDEDLLEKARSIGIKHIITKPIEADQLLDEIKVILSE